MQADPTAILKPATADLVVRDPLTRAALLPQGEPKPLDTYWCRRLRDGDVLIQQDQALAVNDAIGLPPKPVLKPMQGSPQ